MPLPDFDPTTDFTLLGVAALLPLVAAVLCWVVGRRLPGGGGFLGTLATGVAAAIGLFLFGHALHQSGAGGEPFRWFSREHGLSFDVLASRADAPGPSLPFGILYDGLGSAMFAVVTTISFLVHLYSIGYMREDPRRHVYFGNIGLFTTAMLGLVLADNLLLLFVCWELMGFASWLLIGHYAHDPLSPRRELSARAATKAFLTTRIGDVCLLLALGMLYSHYGTLELSQLWRVVGEEVGRNSGVFPEWLLWTGMLILVGVIGKSAQFPLHGWLPDAMEGPTPVSAMIHAATMVAAGVFLLGRSYPLLAPAVLDTAAVVGAFTAIFAATVASAQNGIKAVLAWSTISQLGFMVAAVGLGGVVAGMFHMVTHAFFKACLFLSAGSVIHGSANEHDLSRMGGLRKSMPITFACMALATMAIAGVPLFAGFYSKDAILQVAFERAAVDHGGPGMFASIALPVAAAFTSFYMFRLLFLAFFGAPRTAHQAHESHWTLLVPLIVLAALSVVGGHLWVATPMDLFAHDVQPWFRELVSLTSLYGTPAVGVIHGIDPDQSRAIHSSALAVSIAAAGLGLVIAWLVYVRNARTPSPSERKSHALSRAAASSYHMDQLAHAVVVAPVRSLARLCAGVDRHLVDGAVVGGGWAARLAGLLSAAFDRVVVDGAVNALGALVALCGSLLRLLQTGRIQQYAAFALIGGIAAAAWLILSP